MASIASTSTLNRSAIAVAAACARCRLRLVMATRAPSFASITAARCPTGPVPASTTARLSCSDRPCASHATPAAAVVFEPLLSSSTETRKLAKNFFFTAFSSASPSAMFEPPTKIAVNFFSFGARVKMAPSTSAPTLAGVTPPYAVTWSAPPS